ncbi:MAG: hypothetical protein ACI9MR_002392 [Myxococcota bacterium]|jgi:hypothetical protein
MSDATAIPAPLAEAYAKGDIEALAKFAADPATRVAYGRLVASEAELVEVLGGAHPATSPTQHAVAERRLFDALEADGVFEAVAESPRPWWRFAIWPTFAAAMAAIIVVAVTPPSTPDPFVPRGVRGTLPDVSVRLLCIAEVGVTALAPTSECAGAVGFTYQNVSDAPAWLRVATKRTDGSIVVSSSVTLAPNADEMPVEIAAIPTADALAIYVAVDTAEFEAADVEAAIAEGTLTERFGGK